MSATALRFEEAAHLKTLAPIEARMRLCVHYEVISVRVSYLYLLHNIMYQGFMRWNCNNISSAQDQEGLDMHRVPYSKGRYAMQLYRAVE